MVYINQKKYPNTPYITKTEMDGEDYEKGQHTTISSSGCGLCSAVIVADRLLYQPDFDLEAAIRLSYETKANGRMGTSYKKFVPAFAERLNLRYDDMERLVECLQTGGVAVANVGGDREGHIGVFSHIGHYIVVLNVEPDGRLAILDPAYSEHRYEEEGRVGKVEVKHEIIALCAPEVLKEDTANRSPAFYLFWRK